MILTGLDAMKATNKTEALSLCLQMSIKLELEKAAIFAPSSFGSEYVAASVACKELIWLFHLYAEMLNLEN